MPLPCLQEMSHYVGARAWSYDITVTQGPQLQASKVGDHEHSSKFD